MVNEKKLRIAREVMAALRCAPDPSTDRMARVIANRLSDFEMVEFQYVLDLAGSLKESRKRQVRRAG